MDRNSPPMSLHRFNIAFRLGSAFSLLLIMLLGAIFLGLFQMSRINQSTDKIVSQNWVAANEAATLKEFSNDTVAAMLDLFRIIDPDEMIKLIDREKKNREKFAQALPVLKKRLAGTQSEQLLSQIELAEREFETSIDKTVDFFMRGQRAEAIEYLSREGMGKLDPLEQAVGKLIQTQSQAMTDSGQWANNVYKTSRAILLVIGGGSILLGITLSLLVTRSIVRPLSGAGNVVTSVAEGDLTAFLDIDGRDELSYMGRRINEMVAGLRSNFADLQRTADHIQGVSGELGKASGQVATNSEQSTAQIREVSGSSDTVSRNIAGVAAAAEEMSIAVKGIAQQTVEASTIARRAVEVSNTSTGTIAKLGQAGEEIGSIVKTISTIAQQTNLLALNATIEAARAGEVGKGFAVVAHEVKELAAQTAKATQEISTKVSAMQTLTQQAVQANSEITGIIDQIHGIQELVAGSVEEQAATTSEISKLAAQVSADSMAISKNLGEVSLAASSSTEAAEKTNGAASELGFVAQQLTDLVSRFRLEKEATEQSDQLAGPEGPRSGLRAGRCQQNESSPVSLIA